MPGQFINAAILCACSWFAAVEMIRLAADKDWLHKATKEIAKHWWHKRRRHMDPLDVKAGFGPVPGSNQNVLAERGGQPVQLAEDFSQV